MKLSPITKNQLQKILKAAAYLAISSIISGLIALTTDNPQAFGVLTPFINLILVIAKQAFTESK